MDLLGVLVLGTVTATGGGTLRDVLLGDFPPFCFKNETYLYISLAVSLLVFLQHRRFDALKNPLLYFDAVGLGTFVVIGTGKALDFNMGFIGAVTMGIMTATAGGVIRDVLSNRIPLILRKEVYASACLAGAALMTVLHRTPLPPSLVASLAALTVIALRLLAIRHNWSLPKAKAQI
jgi:uncharacterized membrane protein YeiH